VAIPLRCPSSDVCSTAAQKTYLFSFSRPSMVSSSAKCHREHVMELSALMTSPHFWTGVIATLVTWFLSRRRRPRARVERASTRSRETEVGPGRRQLVQLNRRYFACFKTIVLAPAPPDRLDTASTPNVFSIACANPSGFLLP
jgi:hypothetical protein